MQNPRVGAVATVRNRRGIISAVEPFDGESGRLHLINLEYKDDQLPLEDRLVWELEPKKDLLEPTELPQVNSTDPMPTEDFDALLRAARWTATSPFLDPDGDGPLERMPISSPFHGAVQVEDYQLVPLLKALQMPRVSLLIADDVGLGKTIEAGLILSELLIRRRIQRVLILTPASLRLQWRDEMWDKFSLRFNLIDRNETHQLRRSMGIDANPWRSFSRSIASYHYLRQDDILEQFRSACQTPEDSPNLPWDLLIVDECHNLMPSPFGDDSGLCKMLREIAPYFEHKLFLSATPHNGHTRSYSGLLELLDPVRFSQTNELKKAERDRIKHVVIRRLKREINERTDPPRFCTRNPPQAIMLGLSAQELQLSESFSNFRLAVRKAIASGQSKRRQAGTFAVEILGKRLLSCPSSFAESWKRCKLGLAEDETAQDDEITAVERSCRQETSDDQEAQARENTAATVVGAWLKTLSDQLTDEIAAIDEAVAYLKLDLSAEEVVEQNPAADTRFAAVCKLIDDLLLDNGEWKSDERLIIFTEYKTTLDYLIRRLRTRYDEDRFLTLFGGMDDVERELVKDAFNDPGEMVRVLVATDAASEGLNLQRTARYMLHFDCPWNPSKLEQRNGRLDRHGQARDVTIHHFVSDQDHDLKFLSHVIHKVEQIREDLGSTGELFDEATHRRLVDGEAFNVVQAELDQRIELAKGRASIEGDDSIAIGEVVEDANAANLEAIAAELDLDATSMKDTLEAAMAIIGGRPQLECDEAQNCCRVIRPDLPGWAGVIDESLRRKAARGMLGAVPKLAFNEIPFLEDIGGRMVFTPKPDVLMMHLSHPMLQKALSSLTRRRFPGANAVSRWSVRRGGVPDGVEALILLSVEELAVNDLRESYHHWVRTIQLPIQSGELGEPLVHQPALQLRDGLPADESLQRTAKALVNDLEPDLRDFIRRQAERLTAELQEQLALDLEAALDEEEKRYRSRQGEISVLIESNTTQKLEKEVELMKAQRKQGVLAFGAHKLDEMDRSIQAKEEELARRTAQYEAVRRQLEKERIRILKYLLPKRYAMEGTAQIFPVSIEVRFPGGVS